MDVRSERTGVSVGCSDPVSPAALVAPLPSQPEVAVVRTSRGWSVVGPAGTERVDSLVEGLSLADLIGEEFGGRLEPDRTARRSARGPAVEADAEDPRDARIATLERTVTQLEHALAARVSTERAIGVLAEREGISPRAAFEGLRQRARSSGRPVHELAREVLDSLAENPAAVPPPADAHRGPEPAVPGADIVVTEVSAPAPRPRAAFARRVEHPRARFGAVPGAAGDGRS